MEEQKIKRNRRRTVIAAAGILTAFLVILFSQRKEPVSATPSVMDMMCEPSGITKMEDGSFLVTDTYGKQIWQVRDGASVLYAGGETVEDAYGEPMGGYNDALPLESYFKCPWAIAPFLDGYAVSDADNDVVRLVREDSVQTVNASTRESLPMTDMGVAFSHPTGLAADEDGNLYIADTMKNAIRKVTPEGNLTTVVSDLSEPMGLCWKDGSLYVAEAGANRIIKVQDGSVSLVAGSGAEGMADGDAAQAFFSAPQGIAVGEDGTVYVSDTGNSAIRMVRDGQVTTLLARESKELEAFSPVFPVGLLLDGDKLYICDNFSRKVFTVTVR